MPYSRRIRSCTISMCSSPIPQRIVWGGRTGDDRLCGGASANKVPSPPVGSSYLARVGVDPDFEAGVLSLEAVERVLEIFNKSNYQVNASFAGTGGGKLSSTPPPLLPVSLTSLLGHGGRFYGAEEDGIGDFDA